MSIHVFVLQTHHQCNSIVVKLFLFFYYFDIICPSPLSLSHTVSSLHASYSLACKSCLFFITLHCTAAVTYVCPDHLITSAMSVNPKAPGNKKHQLVPHSPVRASGYFCGKDWCDFGWSWLAVETPFDLLGVRGDRSMCASATLSFPPHCF